jgi:hypothetical protein
MENRLSQLCRRNHRRPFLSESDIHTFDGPSSTIDAGSLDRDQSSLGSEGIRNYNRKEWTENSYQYMDSVWHRLKVIQVNKNLLQKEVSLFQLV